MKYQKLFLWDVDGVLIWHHHTDPMQDWRSLLAERKWLVVWEAFQKSSFWTECLADSTKDVSEALRAFMGGERCRDNATEIIQLWLNNNVQAYRPACACLKNLLNAGYQCAIASNQDARRAGWLKQWLQKEGLGDIPHFISCDLGVAKPEAAFFRKIENSLQKSGHDLVLLDDRLENIAGARKQGWSAHHVTPDFFWPEFYDAVTNGRS